MVLSSAGDEETKEVARSGWTRLRKIGESAVEATFGLCRHQGEGEETAASSAGGGEAGWVDLDERITGLARKRTKYSRWKLKFRRGNYDRRKAQCDCIGSVLDEIIYAERWHFVPKENGDVVLKLTARTPDEHKTVELYVRELELYSRSEFYIY